MADNDDDTAEVRGGRRVTLSRRAEDGCVVPLEYVDASGQHHELSEREEHSRIHSTPQYAREQQAARHERARRPPPPDPERVSRTMRLHELATDLKRRHSELSYRGAVLRAARIQDAEPDAEPQDDDRGSLHREAAIYMTEHQSSYKEALFAVARRRASETSTDAEQGVQWDRADLHAAAEARMAREPGMSYREALSIEAAAPGARPSKIADATANKAEQEAPSDAEVEAYMKKNGGTYKEALIELMTQQRQKEA